MMGSRCFPVPLANTELCDNKNFRLIIVTIQAKKPWNCLSRDVYRKIYSAMQIDMGPGTHRALLKLTLNKKLRFWCLQASQIRAYCEINKIFLKKKNLVSIWDLGRLLLYTICIWEWHFSHARFLCFAMV